MKEMTSTETIEVPYNEFHERMKDIVAANGLVTRMEVKPSSYVLTVKWPDENTAGGATVESATPPVQHEYDSNNELPMAQA